jgi:hypothetical protein
MELSMNQKDMLAIVVSAINSISLFIKKKELVQLVLRILFIGK